ncbi:hypothetical protein [Lentilactobacillus kosonis]|uniref:Uncharacterized protein n=1 Tax=Lentilactobacillus kosonis TaxID=2810561 RepID=A0A401FJB7_9LACO|nr:hypothetical protein [Lentilactobacillus kosonis]GAY72485.1 hypothetical protein NBRC111893_631 [Lentilactobacillus kosonis]
MKKYNAIILLVTISFLSLLSGCGASKAKSQPNYFTVNIKNVSGNSNNDGWRIQGDTKAPNGYYIVGISNEGTDLNSQVITGTSDTSTSKFIKGIFMLGFREPMQL